MKVAVGILFALYVIGFFASISLPPPPCADVRHWQIGDSNFGASGTWCTSPR